MLTEGWKARLAGDRAVASITLRVPVDVVESLKAIAPRKELSGYQTLLKAYISEGLRRDEAAFGSERFERLALELQNRGVSEKVIAQALRDIAA